MNLAFVHLQLNNLEEAKNHIDLVEPTSLGKRAYLFYGIKAEYYLSMKDEVSAVTFLDKAIEHVSNESEKAFLIDKRKKIK